MERSPFNSLMLGMVTSDEYVNVLERRLQNLNGSISKIKGP